MELWEAILLGIIQGLTEFLPVSSSGHLELGKVLLGVELTENLLFSVLLHLATALSTVLVYRKDIAEIIVGIFKRDPEHLHFAGKILLSMIPVGIVGVFFKDQVESFFEGNVLLVGCMLLVTGGLLLLTLYVKRESEGAPNYWQALVMGIAQAIAVLPGISRSGSTIATGLLTGVSRESAARFSFLMVLPPILGANLLEIKDYLEEGAAGQAVELLPMLAGFVAAFVFGWLACVWMIRLVTQGRLILFSYYCFIVGAIAIGAALM